MVGVGLIMLATICFLCNFMYFMPSDSWNVDCISKMHLIFALFLSCVVFNFMPSELEQW